MQTPSDAFRRRGAAVALAFVCGVLLVAPAPAAAARASSSAMSASARRDLRQGIESRYIVSAVHNGVLLKPRAVQATAAVHEVEVSGDSVIVNGARFPAGSLRSWLGDADSALVLRLLELSPAERQSLFDLKIDVAAGGAPPPVSAAAAGAGSSAGAGIPPGRSGAPVAPAAGSAAGRDTGWAQDGVRAEEGGEPEPPRAPLPPKAPKAPESPETPEMPEAPQLPEVVIAPTPPMSPKPPTITEGSQVRFGSQVVIERNVVADDVTTIGGPVRVEGEVNRDVYAVGGSVRINGHVGGDVTAVGGSVHLGPHAEVMGDVAAVGGSVTREEGAVVHGSLSDVGRFPGLWDRDEDRWFFLAPFGRSVHFARYIALLVFLMLVSLLMVLLAPRLVEDVRARIAGEPGITFVAGFLGGLLALPTLAVVAILLVITIIGCVLLLAYPIIFIALGIALFVGFAGAALQMGRVLETRFNWRLGGPYLATLIGTAALELFSFIGHAIGVAGGVLTPIAHIFLFFGTLVRFIAWTMGFGAVILSAFANRPRRFRGGMAGAPAPLPVPGGRIGGGLP